MDNLINLEAEKTAAHRKMLVSKKLPRHPGTVATILEVDPEWRGVIAFDELAGDVVNIKEPPKAKKGRRIAKLGHWDDVDYTRLSKWFLDEYEVLLSDTDVRKGVAVVAQNNPFHPICRYLEGLTWDGVERLPGMLSEYFAVEPSEYASEVGRMWMISAVARVMVPGCKVDTMLILEGPQGVHKSMAFAALAGERAWYSDTALPIGQKNAAFEQLNGKWIYSFDELTSFRGDKVDELKNFLTKGFDNYRPAYGHRTKDHLRHCVFAGSTNKSEYLIDPTGNRRFWPVMCGKIDIEAIKRDRDQLWAEAFARYKRDEKWWVTDPKIQKLFEGQQAERQIADGWEELVEKWLRKPTQRERAEDGFTTTEILSHGLMLTNDRINRSTFTRVGIVLSKLGFCSRKVTAKGGDGQPKRAMHYFAPEGFYPDVDAKAEKAEAGVTARHKFRRSTAKATS